MKEFRHRAGKRQPIDERRKGRGKFEPLDMSKGGILKEFLNTLAAIATIIGLILSGAEVQSFYYQVLANTAGVCLFAAGMLCLARINREG
jgi:hypothetical protein